MTSLKKKELKCPTSVTTCSEDTRFLLSFLAFTLASFDVQHTFSNGFLSPSKKRKEMFVYLQLRHSFVFASLVLIWLVGPIEKFFLLWFTSDIIVGQCIVCKFDLFYACKSFVPWNCKTKWPISILSSYLPRFCLCSEGLPEPGCGAVCRTDEPLSAVCSAFDGNGVCVHTHSCGFEEKDLQCWATTGDNWNSPPRKKLCQVISHLDSTVGQFVRKKPSFSCTLQKSNTRGSQAPNNISKAKKNVIKTLLTVSIFFLLCWTWNFIYIISYTAGAEIQLGGPVYSVTVYLVFCNSMVNPVIYSVQYVQFKNQAKKLFCGSSAVGPSLTATDSSATGNGWR